MTVRPPLSGIACVTLLAACSAPSAQVRRSDGTVNFLEASRFRDDARFRMHGLACRAP